ncbi:MAG: PAS domain-containing sensor histidine kinase [Candidatus Omnitrophica bacterium CG11_big_fil_rev_8_21_14_0_20_63_9]|nr:MAG: PAS domain-containing sensor histidine kinase [Candidatus Omnitrophica bacterium CG11_big_fil_rev_8_21_14_0_20_63_9]
MTSTPIEDPRLTFPQYFRKLAALVGILILAGAIFWRIGAGWLGFLVLGLVGWIALRAWIRPLQDSAQQTHLRAQQLERRLNELESQQHQAEVILASMTDSVCALDREGYVVWLNPAAQRVLGWTADQVFGKRLTELLRQPELEALIAEVVTQNQPRTQELRLYGPPERILRLQAAPCEGGTTGAALVLVAQDVTETRRLENLRREFVANVSHELKTPLTSIKGLVETLLNGALEDPANNRRFVTLIEEDAVRLNRLIDDLLDLSRIESRALTLQLHPVPLRPLFEQVAATFQTQLQAGRVALTLSVPADLPPVKGDPERLRQIFINLIDNAIKFNKSAGQVEITATVEGAMARVAVRDTGSGIPTEDLPRVFERFYRVDKARSRALGGTGLGLAIVKHLVELHEGRVEAHSRPGQGSTFTVILPLA